jgi:hypothetical protein
MRRAFVLSAVIALAMSGTASAAVTVSVSDGTVGAGGAATVPVTVTCEKGFEVLEAHLGLSQDDQTINGMAGLTRVKCKGKPVTVSVTVTPFEGAFHAGSAHASPFVLVIDPKTDETQSGGTAQTITLKQAG